MSTSVSCLCSRVSVVHHMCVGMEAFNVFCCGRVVANLCPLTETSTCAKMSREGGRERADTMRWCHRPCGVAIQSDCLRWWCSMLSKRPNTIMSVVVRKTYVCEPAHVPEPVFVCVCTCVNVYVYYMCRKPAGGGDWGVSTPQCSTHLPGCWWCHSLWRLALLSLLFAGDKINVEIEKRAGRKASFMFLTLAICAFEFASMCILTVMFACMFQSAV